MIRKEVDASPYSGTFKGVRNCLGSVGTPDNAATNKSDGSESLPYLFLEGTSFSILPVAIQARVPSGSSA